MEQQFQRGDRVLFDVEGSPVVPFGSGIVSRVTPMGGVIIQPDNPIAPQLGSKITNIRKVESQI